MTDTISKCIIVLGAVSTQQYIFRSNKLKENIGASWLVRHWLGDGLVQFLRDQILCDQKIVVNSSAWESAIKGNLQRTKLLSSNADCEVIFIGGGNAVLAFKSRIIAEDAVFQWSKAVLQEAPGLRVAVGYGILDNSERSLIKAYWDAVKDLEKCENALPDSSPLLALPIFRTCSTTGLPASYKGTDPEDFEIWLSSESYKKREVVGNKDT